MHERLRLPLALVAVVALLAVRAPAAGALPSVQPSVGYGVDGPVRAMAEVGNLIWLGGSFGQIQDQAGNAVAPASGLAAFDAASGTAVTSIHLPQLSWNGGTATVYDLSAAPDGTLYLVGDFDAVDGIQRWNAAAIDASTGALLPFAPHVESSMVVYASSSAVYVGGQFLHAYRPDGNALTGWSVPEAWVSPTLRAHTTYPDFRDVTQVGQALVVACVCDKIYDAAHPSPTGVNVKAVVQLDAATGVVLPWAPGNLQLGPSGASTYGISALTHVDPATTQRAIYLAAGGNDFTAAYDLATGAQLWKTDTSGSSQAVAWYQGALVVGGHFDWSESPLAAGCGDNANPAPDCYHTPKLTAMDPGDGHVLLVDGQPWNPVLCCKYNGVWALAVGRDDATLHVGGEFTKAGGAWELASAPDTWRQVGGAKAGNYAHLPGPAATSHPLTVANVDIGAGSGIVTSDVGGIACGTDCDADLPPGTSVTLTAAPAPGYAFLSWGGDCDGTALACHLSMDGARHATASFGVPTYPIVVTKDGTGSGKVTSDVGGINCGSTCAASLATGSSVTLTATAVTGSAFTGWAGDCAEADLSCVLTIDRAHAVVATFAPAKRLTLTKAGGGGGTVTSSPGGLDCGPACSIPFPIGSIVTLTATPDANSTFAGWIGKDAAACAGAGPCQVTMSAQRSVTAAFDPIVHRLATALAGDGAGSVTSDPVAIACPDTCTYALQQGTVVTLTAMAEAGSVFAGWTGDCAGTGPCSIVLDADHAVTATFTALHPLSVHLSGTGGGLVDADVGGIDCPARCTAELPSDTVALITAAPDAGSAFAGWGGDCADAGTASTCEVTMGQERNVEAIFTAVHHGLGVTLVGDGAGGVTSAPDGIDCGATCGADLRQGTNVILTATPILGATFIGWGGDCSGTGVCQLTMDGDHAVTATFLPAYQVTVSPVGGGGGIVTDGDPNGIACGTTCSKGYLEGTLVTLRATADAGSVFAGWGGDCGGSASTCILLVDGDHAVTASFAPVVHQLSVGRQGDGSGSVTSDDGAIDCGTACSATIRQASTITLNAAADAGSVFTGWSGDCAGSATTCVLAVGGDRDATATFKARYGLVVTRSGAGAGTVTSDAGAIACGLTCSDVFTSGDVVTLSADPDADSTFAGWTGDPTCDGLDPCELTMDRARSVTATFAPIVRQLTVTTAGSGSVTSAPGGIACGAICGAGFAQPTQVSLSATPATGWFFSGWGGACTGSGPCVVTMDQARSVSAVFVQAPACGRILFTTKRAGNIDVWAMRADGTAQTRLTTDPGADGQARWSPDCAHIAFVSSRSGTDQVYVMNADGSGAVQLTSAAGNTQPAWSPDGSRIAFVSDRAGGQMIYAMDADGRHVTLLSTGITPGDAHPDWSPDGTRIAFTSRRTGGNQAWVMNADGSNPVRLTKNLAACQDPAWSPSGARIAVICKSSGTLQVWTVSPTGAGAQRVTTEGKIDAGPTWSPDGSRIAYSANTSGSQQVWSVSADGGTASNLSGTISKCTEPNWS